MYGNFYDWWDAVEIRGASLIGLLCLAVNLWRASFLHHPYISFRAMKNRNVVRANPDIVNTPLGQLYGMVQTQALVLSMKEIFGWLLIIALASLIVILVSYSSVRPFAIFPKWSTIRRVVKHIVRTNIAFL